jgi:hypothetical protein
MTTAITTTSTKTVRFVLLKKANWIQKMWVENSPHYRIFNLDSIERLMEYVKTIKIPYHLEINKNDTAKIRFLTEHELNNFVITYLDERPTSIPRNIRITYLE